MIFGTQNWFTQNWFTQDLRKIDLRKIDLRKIDLRKIDLRKIDFDIYPDTVSSQEWIYDTFSVEVTEFAMAQSIYNRQKYQSIRWFWAFFWNNSWSNKNYDFKAPLEFVF